MRIQDLHELPKIRDSWSYLYVEHCRIDQEDKSIAVHDQFGSTPVPCASISLLMLGPGSNITHRAVLTLADNGCLVVWCGEQGVRFYAAGMGETRNAANLIKQAQLFAHPVSRLNVVRRLYEMRFNDQLDPDLTLQQIRGMEGARVRDAYAECSRQTGVVWRGRNYDRSQWKNSDPVNRALSCANSCLYGVCHAAIVAMGFSPGLGFIHIGKQLSFVYDIADLYKTDVTVPAAFKAATVAGGNLERSVRHHCRDMFAENRLLARIAEDLQRIFDVEPEEFDETGFDSDPAQPGALWDPSSPGGVKGGTSYDTGGDNDSHSG